MIDRPSILRYNYSVKIQFDAIKRAPQPLPIYEQIYRSLLQKISSGELSEGARLPSESELMRDFHASRQPVRYALDALEASGLIYRAQGRGSFVRRRMIGFSELLRDQGHEVVASTLLVEAVIPNIDVSQNLEIQGPGQLVIHIRRTYDMDGEVLALFDIYLRPLVTPQMFIEAGNFPSLYQIMREFGYRLWDAIETIGACTLQPDIAEILKQEPGSAGLLIRRISRSPEGEPLEYAIYYVRPDRYEYQVYVGAT
jgi:GntR family transcriptional regulator